MADLTTYNKALAITLYKFNRADRSTDAILPFPYLCSQEEITFPKLPTNFILTVALNAEKNISYHFGNIFVYLRQTI